MNSRGIDQAENRLKKAKEAYSEMRDCTTVASFCSSWTDFLSAANTIYSKLEQSSKADKSSTNWFGRKKGFRKKDPLLCYIFHARNSDEHSIDTNSTLVGKAVRISEPGTTAVFEGKEDPDGIRRWHVSFSHPDGHEPATELLEPSFILLPVVDRGDTYTPPKTHLGNAIEGTDPILVSELAIKYLSQLIAEAKEISLSGSDEN